MAPPGDASNPVDVDADPPVYEQGTVDAPLDLTQGEADPICFICLDARERGSGGYCNQIQPCCKAQCHQACYLPWAEKENADYESVSCPACRVVLVGD